jgi:hypothetical protein
MTAEKAKGTRWEREVVTALSAAFGRQYGLDPHRAAPTGARDSGDIHGVSPFIVQAKDWRSWEDAIRIGLDGAEEQRVTAGEDYGVVVVKRARRPVGSAYAVTTLATWARLLLRLRRAESLLAALDPTVAEQHRARTQEDSRAPWPTSPDAAPTTHLSRPE